MPLECFVWESASRFYFITDTSVDWLEWCYFSGDVSCAQNRCYYTFNKSLFYRFNFCFLYNCDIRRAKYIRILSFGSLLPMGATPVCKSLDTNYGTLLFKLTYFTQMHHNKFQLSDTDLTSYLKPSRWLLRTGRLRWSIAGIVGTRLQARAH